MSVATTTSKIQYTLTTGSQALAVPFYFLDNTHIKAIRVATDTLPKADLVLGTDYTLTGAGNPSGGTLTTIATVGNGLTAGSKVVIKRNLPITQPTSYSPNDAFPAKVHEAALDRGIMIAQQSDEQSDRAIRFPEDDSTAAELPTVADRSNKALGFNASGGLEMKTLVGADGILEDESVGESALEGAFRSRAQASVALMKAQSYTNAKTGDRVELLGYYTRGDGGGGLLYVDKADTTTADNGVTVFVAADGTRLKRPYSGVINARWSGSKGDGSTNNTTAIVAAINALLEMGGGTLEFDRGVFITDAFTVPQGITILGYGRTATIKQRAANTGTFIRVFGSAINISGLVIDGNRALQGVSGNAIQFSKPNGTTGGSSAIAGGLLLTSGPSAGASSISVSTAQVVSGSDTVKVQPNDAIRLLEGAVEEVVRVSRSYTAGATTITLQGPLKNSFTTAAKVAFASTDISIKDCSVYGSGFSAISLWHCVGGLVEGNDVYDTSDTLIDVEAGCVGCRVTNNNLLTNGSFGIAFDDGAEPNHGTMANNSIVGNTVTFLSGGSVSYDGIFLGLCTLTSVAGNTIDIRNGGSNGIRLMKTNTLSTVSTNTIIGRKASSSNGILVSGPDSGMELKLIATSNTIRSVETGINLDNCLSANASCNSIYDVSGAGVQANINASIVQNIKIISNLVDSCAIGVNLNGASGAASLATLMDNTITNESFSKYIYGAAWSRRTTDSNGFSFYGTLNPQVLTVSTLPTASSVPNGAMCIVTDSSVTTYRSIVAAGGSSTVRVMSDLTNWLVT